MTHVSARNHRHCPSLDTWGFQQVYMKPYKMILLHFESSIDIPSHN